MKWFLVLQVLGLIVWIEAKPASLRSLIQSLHRRTADCDDLSAKTDRLLNYVVVHQLSHPGMPVSKIRQIWLRATGSDILQYNELRRILCRLTAASSLSELRTASDDLNMTYSEFRFGYDAGVAAMDMARQSLEHGPRPQDEWSRQLLESLEELMDLVEEAGLHQLDPEGVQWARENLFPTFRPHRRGLRKSMRRRQSSGLCDRFYSTVNTLLDLTLFNNPRPYPPRDQVIQQVRMWTGVDLEDSDQIRSLVCGITGIQSIQGIIDLLDANQILDHAMATGYPFLVQGAGQVKAYYERIIQEVEEAENETGDEYGNGNNPYYYYNGGGVSPWKEREAEFGRLFIPFYESLVANGFFSLEVDLPRED